MVVEASFTVDQADFPLTAVFEDLANVTIELDRVVPTTKTVVPYFWIYSDDTTRLQTDLSAEEGIEQVKIIDQIEERMLIRIEWNLDHESILTAISNTDVTLLSGKGFDGEWTFKIRADDHGALPEFQAYCETYDLPITLEQLHAVSPIDSEQPQILTDDQREALELAYDRGYFDSPRCVTQDELGEELGISHQSVSSLLQRGLQRLVASTIVGQQA